MENPMVKEYKTLLEQKRKLEAALVTLPQGYISKKNIKGKSYSYLQQRVFGKLVSRYLKADEVAETTKQLAQRKKYESEIPQMLLRLSELEQAACLMDRQISRGLLRLKIIVGMDSLDPMQKEKSFAFANAINDIEGIPISQAAAQEMAQWQDGSKSFLSVFEGALKRYGFPTEVR